MDNSETTFFSVATSSSKTRSWRMRSSSRKDASLISADEKVIHKAARSTANDAMEVLYDNKENNEIKIGRKWGNAKYCERT